MRFNNLLRNKNSNVVLRDTAIKILRCLSNPYYNVPNAILLNSLIDKNLDS